MILVTGASGLLGASLVEAAREQGREVVGLYHRHPVSLTGAELLAVDLTEESEIRRIFEKVKPTVVVHCAAETNVDWCEEHPEAAQAINVSMSARIAETSAQMKARMLYVSTDSVFDGTRGHYAESDQPTPVNLYAKTKLEGEQEVLGRNPLAAIARINLYGWSAGPKRSLAEWILGQLARGKVVPGFTDTFFCPILANDLAQVLLAMVDRDLVGLYHVVGSEAVSKYEFARQVAVRFGYDPAQVAPAQMAEANLKAPRPRNTSLNTGKISAALGRPMPDVDSGLRKFAQLQAVGYADRLRSQLTEARG